MYLCLAEKPDVAKKIVAAFPKYKRPEIKEKVEKKERTIQISIFNQK
ncbi:hypothetical protein I6G77_27765 (plasmid) [Bacillus tropicus]|uniref:Uncharacterized protein n=1 Tax=Bacillus tropicus TaxID=2026188 RepID=A0A7T2V944_9BACI|nr:hypothetical protein [Bacillus tropicus]AJG91188.1 hypothetical protein BG03_5638 [Bacillus cereus]QPR80699.1 hypothetical protein I6G77_27765 [Bacillus tropicus]